MGARRFAAAALVLGAACSFAWEDYEPRQANGAGASGGGGAPSANSGGDRTGQGGAPTGGLGGGAGDGGSGAAAGGAGGNGGTLPWFLDDFNRSDDAGIGNGWIEKTPNAFGLAGEKIERSGVGDGYLNNLVYRPSSEELRDVEASFELSFVNSSSGGPQLLMRGQPSTIGTSNQYDAYVLWFPGPATEAQLDRHRVTASLPLVNISLAPAVTTGELYRLRLRAQGANPVQLDAFVERWDGSGWAVIGSGSHSDGDAERIDLPGTVGFAGNHTTSYLIDNFHYQGL